MYLRRTHVTCAILCCLTALLFGCGSLPGPSSAAHLAENTEWRKILGIELDGAFAIGIIESPTRDEDATDRLTQLQELQETLAHHFPEYGRLPLWISPGAASQMRDQRTASPIPTNEVVRIGKRLVVQRLIEKEEQAWQTGDPNRIILHHPIGAVPVGPVLELLARVTDCEMTTNSLGVFFALPDTTRGHRIPPTLQPPQEQAGTARDRLPVRGGMSEEDRRRKDVPADGWVTELHDNGDTYVGECKDSKRHGQGTYTFRDGDTYIGEYHEGLRSGNGKMIFVKGCSYLGEFKDGKCHGHGVFVFADGGKYEGQFKDGFRDGEGVFHDAAGRRISGIWRADEFVKKVEADPDRQDDPNQRQTDQPAEADDQRYVD